MGERERITLKKNGKGRGRERRRRRGRELENGLIVSNCRTYEEMLENGKKISNEERNRVVGKEWGRRV